jgi:hypothetical protein
MQSSSLSNHQNSLGGREFIYKLTENGITITRPYRQQLMRFKFKPFRNLHSCLVISLDNKVINFLAFYIITKDSSLRLIYRSQQTIIVSF